MTGTTVRHLTSRDNPLLARVRKLVADGAAYRKLGELWIEGDHLCSAFVTRGGRATHAVIDEVGWAIPRLRELASTAVSVSIVPVALMNELSTLESPASIGFMLRWTGSADLKPGVPTVVLDRLQDAGNVGAILRTASAFGFAQVVAIKGTVGLWSPKVLRAGMGSHFALSLVEGVEGMAWVDDLRVPLIGTSSHAATTLQHAALPWPCGWVLGHEGRGMSTALGERCSALVSIPQPGGEESLNVAAAAAVCLYESVRQRVAR